MMAVLLAPVGWSEPSDSFQALLLAPKVPHASRDTKIRPVVKVNLESRPITSLAALYTQPVGKKIHTVRGTRDNLARPSKGQDDFYLFAKKPEEVKGLPSAVRLVHFCQVLECDSITIDTSPKWIIE